MIVVYFETHDNSFAERVAMFDTEETYEACLPALKKLARAANMILTESVEEISLKDL